jgi:hypothetical protein
VPGAGSSDTASWAMLLLPLECPFVVVGAGNWRIELERGGNEVDWAGAKEAVGEFGDGCPPPPPLPPLLL